MVQDAPSIVRRSPGVKRRPRPRNLVLIKLRINAGLSPNELGVEAGVSGKTIRDAEEGRTIPLPRTQFAIAQIFDKLPTEIWPLNGGSAE